MIKISDCPITGLERKIVKKNMLFYETVKQVLLECIISHFKDDEIIDNQRIKTYTVTLLASNDTYVNKNTGEDIVGIEYKEATETEAEVFPVEAKDMPNAIGQFDFFEMLQHVSITQYDLILNHINKADSRGKFNN